MERVKKIIKDVEFEVVWGYTSFGNGMIRKYRNASNNSLNECYGRPSGAKKEAFKDCIGVMEDTGGKNHKITGFNGWAFQFAFEIPNEGLAYLTKDHWYIII